jgi:hypothetical protein
VDAVAEKSRGDVLLQDLIPTVFPSLTLMQPGNEEPTRTRMAYYDNIFRSVPTSEMQMKTMLLKQSEG